MIPFHIITMPQRMAQAAAMIGSLPEGAAVIYPAVDSRKITPPKPLSLPGEYGCLLSHVSLIQYAKFQQLPYLPILEDDAILCPDFYDHVFSAFANLPQDWDVLYLGFWIHSQADVPTEQIAPSLYRAKPCWGTHAIVYNHTAYDTIQQAALKPCPIDRAIRSADLVKYACYPQLSIQINNAPSLVTGGVGRYTPQQQHFRQ